MITYSKTLAKINKTINKHYRFEYFLSISRPWL